MHPNWIGITAAIVSLAGCIGVFWWLRTQATKRKVIFLAASMLAALPGASFATYYLHLVSPPAWYYQFRSIPGTEWLIVFIGITAGALAAILPRRYLFAPLLGTLAFSIVPFIKPFIGPIPKNLFNEIWDEDVCIQSTPSTCGAASTASILKKLGMEVTEVEIARDAHSYNGGTEAWYLARAIRARNFVTQFNFEPGFTPEHGLPAVIGVRLGPIGHFIAVLEEKHGVFIVGDPMRGREELSREELEDRYEFTDFHMHVTTDS